MRSEDPEGEERAQREARVERKSEVRARGASHTSRPRRVSCVSRSRWAVLAGSCALVSAHQVAPASNWVFSISCNAGYSKAL